MSGASWNFAQEFVKLPPGHGRRVFEPGSAAPARNDPDGLAASEALEALTSFPDPDFPTFDTNEVQSLWEVGEVALMEHWGLRGARILSGTTPLLKSSRQQCWPQLRGPKQADALQQRSGGTGSPLPRIHRMRVLQRVFRPC